LRTVVAVGAVRADEAGDGNDAGVSEELGDLADAADVLRAVFGGEAEVLVQPVSDVVAVEPIGVLALLEQHLFEGDGDGALAAAGQAGQPERAAFLAEGLLSLASR
jgi:uncharacterized protein YbjT (DUF2867 family)